MPIQPSDLDPLEAAGLLVSDPFVPDHVAYPAGVVVGKPKGVGGNSLEDYGSSWGLNGPDLDAPALTLHAEAEGRWFVTLHACIPGPGPGDFVDEWATPQEAVADILDFFFGDPARMGAKRPDRR